MDNSEQNVIAEIAQSSIIEQRRSRRWKIFFRFLYLALALIVFIVLNRNDSTSHQAPHTAIVDLYGVISQERPLTLMTLYQVWRTLFQTRLSKALF
jgi:protease-4